MKYCPQKCRRVCDATPYAVMSVVRPEAGATPQTVSYSLQSAPTITQNATYVQHATLL
jgi:hypothetical protein